MNRKNVYLGPNSFDTNDYLSPNLEKREMMKKKKLSSMRMLHHNCAAEYYHPIIITLFCIVLITQWPPSGKASEPFKW